MSLYYIVRRNVLLYFKDRSAVFFSLLSVFIVILLMFVFLGNMNQDALLSLLEDIRGVKNTSVQVQQSKHIILMWTIAGMLAVNSFTVPLSNIGLYVQDKQYHKLESFFTAPISRITLLSGYVIAAIINGMIMCSITLGISYIFVISQGMQFLSVLEILRVYALLFVCVSVSSCISLCISQCIHTSNAWGSFSTIAGTLIGFLGGIYLPMTMLPTTIQSILKSLPFLHEASMLRSVFTQQALSTAFDGFPSSILSTYQDKMGITVDMFGHTMQLSTQFLMICMYGIIPLGIALYMLKKHTSFE